MWRDAFANQTSTYFTNIAYVQPQNFTAQLKIYSGTINDYGSSTLLYSTTTVTATPETDGNNENIIYSTGMQEASTSGTASWFELTHSHGNVAYGTVGINGSGSDLEIGSTAITSGQQYIISGLRLRFSNAI